MKNSNMIGRGMFLSFLMFSLSTSTLAQSAAEDASDFDGEEAGGILIFLTLMKTFLGVCSAIQTSTQIQKIISISS